MVCHTTFLHDICVISSIRLFFRDVYHSDGVSISVAIYTLLEHLIAPSFLELYSCSNEQLDCIYTHTIDNTAHSNI